MLACDFFTVETLSLRRIHLLVLAAVVLVALIVFAVNRANKRRTTRNAELFLTHQKAAKHDRRPASTLDGAPHDDST